ncbi:MAG: hypothetical protein H6767_06350 [Candidatus Peribacteria bacterium]|nr:MAG: hypothetical protein H6767_06350 [Candidatus Peribacteria bacterium]
MGKREEVKKNGEKSFDFFHRFSKVINVHLLAVMPCVMTTPILAQPKLMGDISC